jgi:flagellar motor switch protein FliN/FliY
MAPEEEFDMENMDNMTDDDDLEAQMAAAMGMDDESGEGGSDEDDLSDADLEAQMDAAMSGGGFDDMDLENQMAAAMGEDLTGGGEEGGGLGEDDLEAQMAAAMGDSGGDDFMMGAFGDMGGGGGGGDSSVQPVEFQQLRPSEEGAGMDNVERLLDVTLVLSVELGRKTMQIKEILDLGPGKIIELDKLAGEPVDLLVNGKMLAKGEVVVVDENFGVRITDLVDPRERVKMM